MKSFFQSGHDPADPGPTRDTQGTPDHPIAPSGGVRVALLLMILIGLWLRIAPYVEGRPFWFDEAWTWHVIENAGYTDLARWNLEDVHPPLSFLLAKLSSDIFASQAEWALRLPALLAGILCIPAAYFLGRVVHSRPLGLWVAAMVTVDPNMVDQAQQARMFSLLTLFTLVALAWAILLLRRPDKGILHWLGLGSVLALAFWSNQFAVVAWGSIGLTALAVGIGLMADPARRNQAKQLAVGIFVAYLTALLLSWDGLRGILSRTSSGAGPDAPPPVSLITVVRDTAVAYKDMIHLSPLGLLWLPVALAGLALLWRRCRTSTLLLLTMAIVGTLIFIPFRRQVRFIYPRYLIPVQPTLWVGLAAVLVFTANFRLRSLAIGVVSACLLIHVWLSTHLTAWYHQPDRYLIAPQVQYVRQHAAPNDLVAYHPQLLEVMGRYYHAPADPALEAALYHDHKLREHPQVPPQLHPPSIWLVIGMVNYPGRIPEAAATLQALADHFDAPVDPQELNRFLQVDHAVLAKVSPGQIQFRSLGVHSGLRSTLKE